MEAEGVRLPISGLWGLAGPARGARGPSCRSRKPSRRRWSDLAPPVVRSLQGLVSAGACRVLDSSRSRRGLRGSGVGYLVQSCKPDVPWGGDRFLAFLRAAPCCGLEESGGCVRGDVPFPHLGLRICGRTAPRVQNLRFLGCFCCRAGSQVCPRGTTEVGICGVALDQVQSLSMYPRLETPAV